MLRAEGIGPLLADQLTELVGHGPYTVKPVIDLNDAVSVDAYEIPDRIRERVKLTHPVELFPYGTRETHPGMDLDHLQPYDPLGPPGQTNTLNLAPLGRFGHRVKTHAHGWTVRASTPKPSNGPHPTASPSTSPRPAPSESTAPDLNVRHDYLLVRGLIRCPASTPHDSAGSPGRLRVRRAITSR